MKGFWRFLEKHVIFSSLHMKGIDWFSKIEKYFGFSKMDKKNVQKWKFQNVLTDQKFLL